MTKKEQEFLNRYDSGIEFDDIEIQNFIFWLYEADSIKQEPKRWSRTITTITKIENRFFSIEWEQGLTEMQEDSFYNQPIEVKLEEHEEVVIIKEWIPINKNSEVEV